MTKQTRKNRKKWLWIGGGLLLILIVAGFGLTRLAANATQQLQSANTGDRVTAFIGDLAANATASGQVQAQRTAQLALGQSGTVAEVYVQVGDRVEAGDPLLQLDTAVLERAVTNAWQTVAIQEANLAALLAPANAADMAAAEAAVTSAQVALADLQAGPGEEEIAQAEADVRAAEADVAAAAAQLNDARGRATEAELEAAQIQLDLAQTAATQAAQEHSTVLVTEAEGFLTEEMLETMELSARSQALQANANLLAAQETYNQLLNGDSNAVAAASAQLALATAQRDAAQASLELLLQGATAAQIASAEATLTQAEATLDRLRRGPSALQIAQMETAVAQAQTARQTAERSLAEATLMAPFAGTVTAVAVNEGETASGILVELVDDTALEVVLDVDEVDIGKINEGQAATIRLESWPDTEIAGEVVSIAPTATQDNTALVSYRVFIQLAEVDLPILVGMTANADLVTNNLEDVLLVPNAAIRADRETSTYSVNKFVTADDGTETVEEVPVTIGLRDGRYTQITSGLEEGDELLVGDVPPRFQFGNGDGPPEGGGPPFGGG